MELVEEKGVGAKTGGHVALYGQMDIRSEEDSATAKMRWYESTSDGLDYENRRKCIPCSATL